MARVPRSVVDVAHLVWGTAASQVVLLASTVVCARWFFTDAELGELSTAVAVATILATVATLRLEMALPLARTDREARDLVRVVLAGSAGVAAVVGLLVAGLELAGVHWWTAALGGAAWWVPAVVLATAAYQTLRMLQSRLGQFRHTSESGVTGAVVTGLGQVAAGVAGSGSGGLTAAYALGRAVSDLQMARRAGLRVAGRLRWWLVRRWRRFPIWVLLPAVLNALSVGAVAPLIQAWYGKEVAGQFGLAQRLLMAPAALLGQAVAGVFFARFAAMVREGRSTTSTVVTVAEALACVSLPVFVPFVVLGPDVFRLVVGDAWGTAGMVSALLSPWLLMSFVSSPLSGYATVENRLPRMLVLSLIEAGLRVPALAAGVWLGDVRWGIGLYGLAGLVITTYWSAWVLRLSGATRQVVVAVLGPSLVALALAGTLAGARSLLSWPAYVALAAVLVLAVAAVAVLRLRRLVIAA